MEHIFCKNLNNLHSGIFHAKFAFWEVLDEVKE